MQPFSERWPWVPHDVRDAIVDDVARWSERTEIPVQRFVAWLGGGAASKFYDGRARYGLANEHHALVPRDGWLEAWEKNALLDFHAGHPREGYRRNSRDYERSTGSSEAMIKVSSIHRMLRLLMPDRSKKPVPFKYRELQGVRHGEVGHGLARLAACLGLKQA